MLRRLGPVLCAGRVPWGAEAVASASDVAAQESDVWDIAGIRSKMLKKKRPSYGPAWGRNTAGLKRVDPTAARRRRDAFDVLEADADVEWLSDRADVGDAEGIASHMRRRRELGEPVDGAWFAALLSALVKRGAVPAEVQAVADEVALFKVAVSKAYYDALAAAWFAVREKEKGMRILEVMQAEGHNPTVLTLNAALRAAAPVDATLAADVFNKIVHPFGAGAARHAVRPDEDTYRALLRACRRQDEAASLAQWMELGWGVAVAEEGHAPVPPQGIPAAAPPSAPTARGHKPIRRAPCP